MEYREYRLGRNNKGSFTIEAAVIIPIILIVIALVFRYAMFVYDACRLEWATDAASLRASQMIWDSNSERSQIASDTISELTSGKLIFNEDVEKNISMSGDDLSIKTTIDQGKWQFSTTTKKKVMNPYTFIHNYRILKNYAGSGDT